MKKTHFSLLLAGVLATTAIVITALVTTNRVNDQDRFSVTGSGIVYARADIASIQVGFRSGIKKTAVEATTEGTEKMNQIIKTLKDLGIDEKDIKTSDYYLNPSYNWTTERGQELIGYEVSQNLNLKIRNLDQIGEVIARTTEQGANQVGNVNFTIDDEFELRNLAREEAIKKAKEKAQLIASQSGIKLGRVKGVFENFSDFNVPYVSYSNSKMMLDSAMASARDEGMAEPVIQSGQNEVRVEVTLVYEVK